MVKTPSIRLKAVYTKAAKDLLEAAKFGSQGDLKSEEYNLTKAITKYRILASTKIEEQIVNAMLAKEIDKNKGYEELAAKLEQRGYNNEAARLRNYISENPGELEKKLEITAGIFGLSCFILSLLFLSTNITGNIIGVTKSNLTGAILFILALIGIFYYLRKK